MDYRASEYLIPIFDFDVLHLQLNTPVYIFGLVLIVMFFMNKLMFQPVLRTLEQRKTYIDGLESSAGEQQEEIARLIGEYEAKLEAARKEVAQVRADAAREAERVTRATLASARQEADAEFKTACREFKKELEVARKELEAKAQALAEQTANRILA